jgi:hypothetical protein
MDAGMRQKRVEALELIKDKALGMAKEGRDSLEVRDFVTSAKKNWLITFQMKKPLVKLVKATMAYQRKKQK